MSDRNDTHRLETVSVHGGERRPGPEGSLVFPIYQGTVYGYDTGTDYHDLLYLRLNSTPSQRYLHDKLAAIAGAEAALATSSGMAAITSTLLTFLASGDHLLAGANLYGGTHEFIARDLPALGITHTAIDPARPEGWAKALRKETKLIYVETITNPLMRAAQMPKIAAFAREHGLLSIVDNTFASPVNCRPLELGFDLSIHSATKYLNGHSDLVAGCVVGSSEHVDAVRRKVNHLGGTLDPHAGFLLARGLKTLALRVRQQNENGMALARFLATQEAVQAVHYPGLPEHPDHAHAKEFLSGFGGMLSFRLRGGVEAVERLFGLLTLPSVAVSLGSVETLITRPATTSHASLPPAEREAIGITDDLVRVSCGIEATDDLVEDFRRALAA